MAQVKVEGDVAATIDDVWKVIGDFVGFIAAQGLQVTGEGEGIGMLRTLTVGPTTVVERLEALDEANHKTSYSIVSGPIPVTDYLATIELAALELAALDGPATKVTWSATFEPAGVTEDQVTEMMKRTYAGGIKALQRHFAS
jgi:Polyketide cyclase / dehydrase and lipid transport